MGRFFRALLPDVPRASDAMVAVAIGRVVVSSQRGHMLLHHDV